MHASTTTAQHDIAIASIVLLGAMQKSPDCKCSLRWGLPAVTLLGEEADWALMLKGLDKLDTLGEELTPYYTSLQPDF